MNYESIETAIINKLAPLDDVGFKAVVRPENEKEYADAKKAVEGGCVFVGYSNGSFRATTDKPELKTTDVMVQDEVVNVELAFQCRKLRGNTGLFKMIEITKRLVLGFRPPSCTKIYMVRMEPPMWNEGLWTYTLIVACDAMIVEHDEEEVGALIEKIRLENTVLNEDIVVEKS